MEIYFEIHSLSSDFENVIHCGSTNNYRLPTIFIRESSGLYVMLAEGNIYSPLAGGYGFYYDTLLTDTIYHVEMIYNQTWFTLNVNGATVLSQAKSSHSQRLNVPCYASFPQESPANVTIYNVTMWSTSTFQPTSYPTFDPTPEPTLPPGTVMSFGFTTMDLSWADSTKTMTMSLWKGEVLYQCTLIPNNSSTQFVCSADSWNISIGACDADYWDNSTDYKLVLDNSQTTNAVGIESVFLELNDANYTLEAWCIPDDGNVSALYAMNKSIPNTCSSGYTAYRDMCIDQECGPSVVMLHFNGSDPSGTYYDAKWTDATDICLHQADGCACFGLFIYSVFC